MTSNSHVCVATEICEWIDGEMAGWLGRMNGWMDGVIDQING